MDLPTTPWFSHAMRHVTVLALGVLLLAVACGGSTESDTDSSGVGGASGSAGASSAGSAGAGASSGSSGSSGGGDACSVPGKSAGPFDITFTMTNPTAKSIWLWQDCSLSVDVTACPDYATPLSLSGACTTDCASTMGCIECGACQSVPVEVPPGGSKPFVWGGLTYTFGTTTMGCSCHDTHVAPAAKYRLRASVWDTMPTEKGQPDRVVVHDFSLFAKQQMDTVSLAAP